MAPRAENTYSGSTENVCRLCPNLSTGLGPYSAEIECYTLTALVFPKLHFNLGLIRLRWEFLLYYFLQEKVEA